MYWGGIGSDRTNSPIRSGPPSESDAPVMQGREHDYGISRKMNMITIHTLKGTGGLDFLLLL